MKSSEDDKQERPAQVEYQEGKCHNAATRRGLESSGCKGESPGDIKDSTDQPDSQRSNPYGGNPSRRGTTAGGILRQLKLKNRKVRDYHLSQLAYHQSQVEDADEEYAEFEQIEAELREKESQPFPSLGVNKEGSNGDTEQLSAIEISSPGADEEG
jgi:hypothetical protein